MNMISFKEEVLRLITFRKEGEYWDFKAENYISDRYTEEEMEIFERILTDASEKYIEELKKSEQFNH